MLFFCKSKFLIGNILKGFFLSDKKVLFDNLDEVFGENISPFILPISYVLALNLFEVLILAKLSVEDFSSMLSSAKEILPLFLNQLLY